MLEVAGYRYAVPGFFCLTADIGHNEMVQRLTYARIGCTIE
jgi:hypothetical protein